MSESKFKEKTIQDFDDKNLTQNETFQKTQTFPNK